MAGLEELWSRFFLTEEEEGRAEVTNQDEVVIHCLAGKFFTKRVLNVDAVARTFKPLWKPAGELKIRDIEEGILLFEFEDVPDLERVLEYEPWSYDKSLVVLKKVADAEDDGSGGEFLQVRVAVDITKPLLRCCKLWSEGRHIGWVGIQYERLPNFCYWCGQVSHGERDCTVWLRGKGNLKKEDQQYGEWMRAKQFRQSRKSVAVISGSSRSQAPWGRKYKSPSGSNNGQSDDIFWLPLNMDPRVVQLLP
ncbi:hypothetical protein SO802_002843 [Lithocarpus litseifolius]|uniref:CCHC-type domain-containing protein n=1 Tax=Lithocarpus litseifolius TaxID=425828 RepID=A0AAW2E252_9ROSI